MRIIQLYSYDKYIKQIENWTKDNTDPNANNIQKFVLGSGTMTEFLNDVIKKSATEKPIFKKRKFYVAIENDEVLAFADIQIEPDMELLGEYHEINILSVAVNPKYQSKGIGTTFIQNVIDCNINNTTSNINVFVENTNQKSLNMFKNVTFKNNKKFNSTKKEWDGNYLLNCSMIDYNYFNGYELKQITEKSVEVDQLNEWANLKNNSALKKYTFKDQEIDFTELLKDNLAKTLNNVKPKSYVLLHNNEVVGLVIFSLFKNHHNSDKVCFIRHICTHPECQNLGVGAKLLDSVIYNRQNMLGKDYDIILADIVDDNKPSLRLFKKMGFNIVKEKNNYTASLINPKKQIQEEYE